MILAAVAVSTVPGNLEPGRDSPMSEKDSGLYGLAPSVAVATKAYPSIADLSNEGTSIGAVIGCPSTRPEASPMGQETGASGRVSDRSQASTSGTSARSAKPFMRTSRGDGFDEDTFGIRDCGSGRGGKAGVDESLAVFLGAVQISKRFEGRVNCAKTVDIDLVDASLVEK